MCTWWERGRGGLWGGSWPSPILFELISYLFTRRDLGTALQHVRVLSMPECALADLGGIASLAALQELFLPGNHVRECLPLTMLDSLHTVDLSCNAITEVQQVDYLLLCAKLRHLALAGNPVCQLCDDVRQQDCQGRSASVRKLISSPPFPFSPIYLRNLLP